MYDARRPVRASGLGCGGPFEGSEYETLLSAPEESLRRISRINVEFHVPDERAARQKTQLLERLSGIGFRVTRRNEDKSGYGVFFFEN